MSPDKLGAALAGKDNNDDFQGLKAYRLENGIPTDVLREEWLLIVRELSGISANIKVSQPTHEVGYAQWRKESISRLIAGTFVWCDELEIEYKKSIYGMPIWCEEHGYKLQPQLQFAIHIQPHWAALVFEGFEQQLQPATQAKNDAESAEVKKWTDERLAQLKKDRQQYGTKKAAEMHSISTARVRQLLPTPSIKKPSFFDGLGKLGKK